LDGMKPGSEKNLRSKFSPNSKGIDSARSQPKDSQRYVVKVKSKQMKMKEEVTESKMG